MSRQYYVNGSAMVFVKGNAGSLMPTLTELGLSTDQITITINTKHKDVEVDDFGGIEGVPPELLWMGATATIDMTLVNFDRVVLDAAVTTSMAGTDNGIFAGIGTPMGGGRRSGSKYVRDNTTFTLEVPAQQHYLRLYIDCDDYQEPNAKPWQFPTALMTGPPLIYPVGTKATAAVLRWKAIPYAMKTYAGTPVIINGVVVAPITNTEIKSTGVELWKRSFDD